MLKILIASVGNPQPEDWPTMRAGLLAWQTRGIGHLLGPDGVVDLVSLERLEAADAVGLSLVITSARYEAVLRPLVARRENIEVGFLLPDPEALS